MTAERHDATSQVPSDEAGLTLIELIVSVVLMGIVMCGVGTALYQALQIPAEGQARSVSANQRTYAITMISDDVANSTEIKTLKTAEPTDPAAPLESVVESNCPSSAADESLFRLSWTGTTIDYRLRYAPDAPGYSTVALQRKENADDWASIVTGYCKTGEGVLDVLTITPGASTGEEDPVTHQSPYYVNRRVRAQFHIRDTRADLPTLVDIEAAPRTDCRSTADNLAAGSLDAVLPNCEST